MALDPACEGECLCGARDGEPCRTHRHDLLEGRLPVQILLEHGRGLLVKMRDSLHRNPREWLPLAHIVLRGDGWVVVRPWLRARLVRKHY